MSINKFQEKIFRTGCGSAVLYVSAAVFFGGMFYMGCGLGAGGRDTSSSTKVVAVQVGDVPVYFDDLDKMLEQQRAQAIQQNGRSASPDALPPMDEAQIDANVLTSVVGNSAAYYLAQKAGVKFTDDAITKEEEKQLDQETMMTRMQLVQANKLKPDATDKDFDAVLKKEQGMSLTDRKAMFHTQLVKALKDNTVRPQLEMSLARSILTSATVASIKPSLAELKASYENSVFKKILFAAHPGSTVESQIAKAQADLKSGLTFEQVIDRYSSEKPLPGKKLSESTIDISASQFDAVPDYRPLKSVKVGQVTDAIDTPQGKAIYKLIMTKNGAPPDIEANKAKYTQSYASQKAQTQIDQQLKDLMKSNTVQWKVPGLKVMYDWSQIRQDPAIQPKDVANKMGAIVDEAKKIASASGNDSHYALLTWYAAFDQIWTAPGADKTKLRGDRIEVLKALTSTQPYFTLRMELVDLLIDSKAGDEAVDTLKSAASSNFQYDLEGQQDFQEVNAKVMKLKAANMIKPAQEDEIQKIQQEWIKQNQIAADYKAEQKKAQAKADKEAADNAAKQKAATDKQKADAEKAAKSAKPTAPAPAGAGTKPAAGAPTTKPSTPTPPAASGTSPAPGKK